jgi:hypothetical protein
MKARRLKDYAVVPDAAIETLPSLVMSVMSCLFIEAA